MAITVNDVSTSKTYKTNCKATVKLNYQYQQGHSDADALNDNQVRLAVTIGVYASGSIIKLSGTKKLSDGVTRGIIGGSSTTGFTSASLNPSFNQSPEHHLIELSDIDIYDGKTNATFSVVEKEEETKYYEASPCNRVYIYDADEVEIPAYKEPLMDSDLYYFSIKSIQKTTINVTALCKDSEGRTWGKYNNGWFVLYDQFGNLNMCLTLKSQDASAETELDTGSSDSGSTEEDTSLDLSEFIDDIVHVNVDEVRKNLDALANVITYTDDSTLESLDKMQTVIGIPPQITEAADPKYMQTESIPNDFGRAYTEMFMLNNCVFSIQPVKAQYLQGFSDDQKEYFWETIGNAVGGGGDDADLISGNSVSLNGDLFESVSDYNNYINTVNLLARTMALYLGIGDKYYMGKTGSKYKYRNMDYSFYRTKQTGKIAANAGGLSSVASGLVHIMSDAARAAYNAIVVSAINDDTYVHFYGTADGTQTNDELSVSTKTSGIESLFNNGLSELASDIQFLMGSNLGKGMIGTLENAALGIADSLFSIIPGDVGSTLKNLVHYGANYMQGGRLVFPQMIDDCNYDRSYSCSCRFISPSGDPEARFLNCFLPLAYLLPYVLPQALSDNMYRYPFMAKVDVPGLVHCDLSAITNLRIQSGGGTGTSWTADGFPFEIDVSFDITPLYSKLMVTSARHPILFLNNTALHEYLGSMCGVSFTGFQLQLKAGVAWTLVKDLIKDTVPSILRGYYDSKIATRLRKVFNF